MSPRLQALGYVEVETRAASILGPVGTRFRGHQFRYSILDSDGAETLPHLYTVRPKWGTEFEEGYTREWPEEMVMSEEVKAIVARRWREYGLSAFVDIG